MNSLWSVALRTAGARNFGLNLVGTGLPLAVALVAFPVIAHYAGTDRLGALGITWALIGYLGLLDLGLTRVVVRRVSQAGAAAEIARETALASRIALSFLLALVPIAAAVAWALPVYWIAPRADAALREETRVALWMVLLTLPVVVATGVLRGVLEGQQHFVWANVLRVFFGAWSFAAPAAAAVFAPTLPVLVATIVVGRLIALPVHIWVVRRITPAVLFDERPTPLGPLLREGGWLTVSSAVSPLMVTMDRFVVGGLVSLAAVAYYTVPQEIALRLLLIPAALAGTLFPMLAQAHGAGSAERVNRLLARGVLATLAIGLPMCVVFAAFAEAALALWMGPTFAQQSAPAAAVFASGLLANSVAQVPFATLQSAGRSDLPARLHLVELPLFLALLYMLTSLGGLLGAACAWTVRTTADCAALFWLARRLPGGTDTANHLLPLCVAYLVVLATALGTLALDGIARWSVAAIALCVASALAVRWGTRAASPTRIAPAA